MIKRYRHTCPACGVAHTCFNTTNPSHPLARDGIVHYVICPTAGKYSTAIYPCKGLVAVAMKPNGGALPRRLQPNNVARHA